MKPDESWKIWTPLYISYPHKAASYENMNYSLGGAYGMSKHVFVRFYQQDFGAWIPPDPACPAQHFPDGAVDFGLGNANYRLFDALFNGFPPYPPFTLYTNGLYSIATEPPDKFGG
jgi:hypothetical protein